MRSHDSTFPPEIPDPSRGAVSVAPPVPVVFERSAPEELSLRAYAALHLRVPDSGIGWLDAMIRKSREMDAGLRRRGHSPPALSIR